MKLKKYQDFLVAVQQDEQDTEPQLGKRWPQERVERTLAPVQKHMRLVGERERRRAIESESYAAKIIINA